MILLQLPSGSWDFFYVGSTGNPVERFFNHDAIRSFENYEIKSYEVRYQVLESLEYQGTGKEAEGKRVVLERALSSIQKPTWEAWPKPVMNDFRGRKISDSKIWDAIAFRRMD